jgi:hypothetical protein
MRHGHHRRRPTAVRGCARIRQKGSGVIRGCTYVIRQSAVPVLIVRARLPCPELLGCLKRFRSIKRDAALSF